VKELAVELESFKTDRLTLLEAVGQSGQGTLYRGESAGLPRGSGSKAFRVLGSGEGTPFRAEL
jgi:hypothetical protein